MKEKFFAVLDTLLLLAMICLWLVIEGILLLACLLIMPYSAVCFLPFVVVNALLVLAIVCRKKMKMRLLTSVICATVVGVLITAITVVGVWINAHPLDFTSEKWKKNPSGRYYMLEDLKSEHNLDGLSEAEIKDLLGEPTSVVDRTEGYYVYEYYTGYRDYIDPYVLEIVFKDGISVHIIEGEH